MTKGRLGRLSDHTGHNASKRRAGLETHNAEADPPLKGYVSEFLQKRGQGISEKLVTNNFETKEMNRWPELRLSEREWIGKNC